LLLEAGPVERRIVLNVVRRLVAIGQRQYGPLDLATERRDMLAERHAETIDGMIYEEIELLMRGAV
jgi:hypothetical protein